MWLEETFKDFQSGFGLNETRVSTGARRDRLVAALTLAVAWLYLLALPEARVLPRGWATSVITYGRASLLALALAWLDHQAAQATASLPWLDAA